MGGSPSFCFANGQKKPQPKKLSPVPPLGEARGGGWRVHSSLKPEGRRPASLLAGRAVDFRRLAASRHRSFPCSTHSCLDFTRVHITVYQRGSIFFPLLFFLHFSEYKPNGSRKNKRRFCSALQWHGGWERGRGDTCPPSSPDSLAEGFSGHGFGNGSWRGHSGISTSKGRSRSRSCIPAMGAPRSSGGIGMFSQGKCVSRGAQEYPGLGEEEGFG